MSAVSTAWPTLLLALASWLIGLGVLGLALSGAVTSGVGYLGLTCGLWVAAFIAFTPMHDAAHRSVTKRRGLNELVGWLTGVLLLAPFPAFRWVHLEHHKHTNHPEQDPDHYSGRGPRWALPFRWATQDLHYYWRYLTATGRPRAERVQIIASLVTMYSALAALALTGHWELSLAWLVGARAALTCLAFAFDYLPHAPHSVTQKQDRYRATLLIDHPWLTPVLLYQNYHLIHHLYPGVPFYRYAKVFGERRAELTQRGAQARKLFGAPRPLADVDAMR